MPQSNIWYPKKPTPKRITLTLPRSSKKGKDTMPSTLRCYICRTIDPIACPDYDAPDLIITGPLSVFLPNSQVFISIIRNDKGEFLHVKELSDELLILLQEKGEHNVNHP